MPINLTIWSLTPDVVTAALTRVTPVPVVFKVVKKAVSKVFSLLMSSAWSKETSCSWRTSKISLAARFCNSMGKAAENEKSEKIATSGRKTNFMSGSGR